MAAHTSSRKQWRLCRGPKGNVQSLGWAEFGCPESQVKLAKELLEDNGEESVDKEEKARLGVYWLLKASEKGNEEATSMLQECLDNGIGVSEHNLSDVRACLEMPQDEKLSREAAKELFISLSQGENYITSSQLVKEISKFSEDAGPSGSDVVKDWRTVVRSDKLSEEEVVAAGGGHPRGELPAVLKHYPIAEYHCWSPIAVGANRLASLPLFPHPCLFLFSVSLFSLTHIIDELSTILYYLSLLLMVLATCQVLTNRWEFNLFKQWSNALVACGCTEEVSAQAKWAYCTSNSTPFYLFMFSLCLNIIMSSYVPAPPHSEIATLSTLLSLYTLYNFALSRKKIDSIALITFVIHLVARYPYEIDTFVYHYWRYLDVHVPTFMSYVVGSSIEFCLNLRVILYLMLPGFFLKMASRENWLGTYTTLLPHLVSLAWWQVAVTASNGATGFGLIRCCLALVLIVVFIPVTSVSTLLLPLVAIVKFLITHEVSIPFAVSSSALLILLYIGIRHKPRRKFLRFLQVLVGVLSVYIILNSGEVETVSENRSLDWKDISGLCAGEDIENAERCARLSGLAISGEGRVLSKRLASVYNPLEPLLHHLPQNLQEVATCFFGERFDGCAERGGDCKGFPKLCGIANWNKYEYEVGVELSTGDSGNSWSTPSSPGVIGRLRGGRNFRNFTMSLAVGDRIAFTGLIVSAGVNGWTNELIVTAWEARCLHCAASVPDLIQHHFQPVILLFIRRIFNFIFYPLVIFS